MKMTAQDLEILDYLLQAEEIVSVKKISLDLQLSERLVRYYLQKIDRFLILENCQPLHFVKRKGVILTDKKKTAARMADFQRQLNFDAYLYSKEEAIVYLILKIFSAEEKVTVESLMQVLNISAPTVRSYLQQVEQKLQDFELKLVHQKKSGYQIQGPRWQSERLFLQTLTDNVALSELLDFFKTGETSSKKGELFLFNTFDLDQVENITGLIERQERENQRDYTDGEYLEIFVKYFFLEIEVPVDFPQAYKKITAAKNQLTADFAQQLISRVETALGVNLRLPNSNFQHLLQEHINSLNLRIEKKQFAENVLYQEFNAQFAEFMSFLEELIGEVIQDKSFSLPPQEISLIAIYFISEIQKLQEENQHLPAVLIICGEGRIVSNIIANKVRELFQTRRLEISSVRKLTPERLQAFEIVLTTVPLTQSYQRKAILISPQLHKEDIRVLAEHLPWKFNHDKRGDLKKFSQILEVVAENCQVNNWSQLEFSLLNILTKRDFLPAEPTALALDFQPESIKIDHQTVNWEKAIDVATEYLIDNGTIETRYREKIKQNTREFGPYMIVAPGVFFAHASPEDGCLKDGISLVKFTKGIKIIPHQETPVDMILTLAFKNTGGNALLEKTMAFAQEREKMKHLRSLTTEKEIYNYLYQNFFS